MIKIDEPADTTSYSDPAAAAVSTGERFNATGQQCPLSLPACRNIEEDYETSLTKDIFGLSGIIAARVAHRKAFAVVAVLGESFGKTLRFSFTV